MIFDDLALAIVAIQERPADRLVTRLIRSLPNRGSVECIHFELKALLHSRTQEWAELARDVVAFANTGGGVILFGVDNGCSRRGLPTSVISVLDPAKLTTSCAGRRHKV